MSAQPDWTKIAIMPDQDIAPWWEATKKKVFNIGKCNDCGHKYWPPGPGCKKCQSLNTGLTPIKGEGTIYQYNVVTQPILGHLVQAVPYVFAIVELPDGTNPDGSKTRVHGLMRDSEEVAGIGSKVLLDWDDHPKQEYKIPRWKVADPKQKGVWHYPGTRS